jgi:hypothetical protein
LAGCSIAQHLSDYENLYENKDFARKFDGNYRNTPLADPNDPHEIDFEKSHLLSGMLDNKLRRIHPIYNVRFDYVHKARDYFRQDTKC